MKKKEFKKAACIFAHLLGVNVSEEEELIQIAEEGLNDLPEGNELILNLVVFTRCYCLR